MRYTVSLTRNNIFRRLYQKGKTKAAPTLAVYCRRNGRAENRVGIAVSKKIGNAVKRNRARRRLKEAYRIQEERFRSGFDIVIVARVRTLHAPFTEICRQMLALMRALGPASMPDAPKDGAKIREASGNRGNGS